MAILVTEEGENRVDIANIVIWVSLLVVVVIAVYFIFFRKPPLIEVTSPSNYQNTDPLASVNLNPQEVANSIEQTLKPYVPPPSPAVVGRENPFLAP